MQRGPAEIYPGAIAHLQEGRAPPKLALAAQYACHALRLRLATSQTPPKALHALHNHMQSAWVPKCTTTKMTNT
jgi:hypothetical protein